MSEFMWSGQRRQWGDGTIELKKAVTRLVAGVPTRGWAFATSCPSAVDWMSVSDLERETVSAPSERASGPVDVRVSQVWDVLGKPRSYVASLKLESNLGLTAIMRPLTGTDNSAWHIYAEVLRHEGVLVSQSPPPPPTVPAPPNPAAEPRRHSHYFRSVAGLQEIDVYRVLELFGVTDQALGHAIKKLVVPGMRGGGKTGRKDIEEAVDTLRRRLEMMDEDDRAGKAVSPPPPLPEGFTAWDGSSEDGPSLPSGGLVDLMFRDGDVHSPCNPAIYTWRHHNSSGDIVAYRVSAVTLRDHSDLRKTWAPGQRWQVSADGGQSWDDLSSTEPRWNTRLTYRRHPDDVPAVPSQPDDGWLPWDGRHEAGPVRPADAAYEVRLRNGREMSVGDGTAMRWTHHGEPGDIVAYRQVPRV